MVNLAESLPPHPTQRQQPPLLGLALAALLHAAVALLALGTTWQVPEEPPVFEVIFAPPAPAPAPAAQPAPAPAAPARPPAAAVTTEPEQASEPPPATPEPDPPAEAAPRPIAPRSVVPSPVAPRPVAPRPAAKPEPPGPVAIPAENPPPPAAALPPAALPSPLPPAAPAPALSTAAPVAAPAAAPSAPPGLPPLQAYAIQLRNLLAAHREYPFAARQRRQEGVVSIALTIDRAGQLAAVRLYAASAVPLLDEAALTMARRAAPFPPPPLEPHQRQAVFVVPVGFALQD